MRKVYTCLLVVLVMILINTNISLLDIKPVQATKIQAIEHTEYINVNGEFEKLNNTEIIFSFPVIVKDVYIHENQYVNKGQLLFTIDKKAMAEMVADNSFDLSVLNSGYTNQAISNSVFNDIPETVYASEDGTIKNLMIYPGAILMQDKPLLIIENVSDILAKFTVSQVEFGKISVGDSINISPVAFKNKSYTGHITDRDAVVKNQTSLTGNKVVIDVFAHIDNPDKTVADGLQVSGKIQNGQPYMIQAVEYGFINQDDTGEFVFVLKEGCAEKIYIETGIETAEYVSVKNNFPKDTVFIKGNISHGDKVIIVG